MALTEQEMQSILEHMNQDHEDSLRIYVSYYGGIPKVRRAQLRALTRHEMRIEVQGEGVDCLLAIPLNHPIDTAEDARRVLVEMARIARQSLATDEEVGAG